MSEKLKTLLEMRDLAFEDQIQSHRAAAAKAKFSEALYQFLRSEGREISNGIDVNAEIAAEQAAIKAAEALKVKPAKSEPNGAPIEKSPA